MGLNFLRVQGWASVNPPPILNGLRSKPAGLVSAGSGPRVVGVKHCELGIGFALRISVPIQIRIQSSQPGNHLIVLVVTTKHIDLGSKTLGPKKGPEP